MFLISRRLTSTLILLMILAACEGPQHRELQGYLYFPAGSYLGRFDLSDASSSAAANLGDVSIGHLSAIDERRLLVSMRGTNNAKPFSRVVQLDTRSNQVVDLFSGNAAWFIRDGLFYLFDDGEEIISRGRRGGDVSDIVMLRHRTNARVPVTLIDRQDVLYETDNDGSQDIHLFNVATGRDMRMPELSSICTLDGAVWVASEARLLCRRLESGPAEPVYVLASIDGEEVTEIVLPDARSLRAAAYLSGQDAVIFTAMESGWIGDTPKNQVWFHDLIDGQNYLLSEDQFLGDAVAWGSR